MAMYKIGDQVLAKIYGNTKTGKDINLLENQVLEVPGTIYAFIPFVDLIEIKLNHPLAGKEFLLVSKDQLVSWDPEKSLQSGDCKT